MKPRRTRLITGCLLAAACCAPSWAQSDARLTPQEQRITDEALFANTEFLENEREAVTVLVEELLKTWREINANPAVVAELREKYKLLPDLPADEAEEITAYFQESAESKAFPEDGGNPDAVKADFEFYTVSGQLEGDPASLKVEDFWTFDIVEAARKNLGQ